MYETPDFAPSTKRERASCSSVPKLGSFCHMAIVPRGTPDIAEVRFRENPPARYSRTSAFFSGPQAVPAALSGMGATSGSAATAAISPNSTGDFSDFLVVRTFQHFQKQVGDGVIQVQVLVGSEREYIPPGVLTFSIDVRPVSGNLDNLHPSRPHRERQPLAGRWCRTKCTVRSGHRMEVRPR